MGAIASQITSLTIVYSTVYSDADQKKSQLRVIGLFAGNSPETGEFPAQMANNAKNVSIWWRHREKISLRWDTHETPPEDFVIMMVPDALAPNRRQIISNHHNNTSHHHIIGI